MPLDVELFQNQMSQEITDLANSKTGSVFNPYFSFQETLSQELTRAKIERDIIEIAKLIYEKIENSKNKGKQEVNLKLRESFSSDYPDMEKIIRQFLHKVYNVTSEETAVSKELKKRRTSSTDIFQHVLSNTTQITLPLCVWKISWNENPSLMKFPLSKPVFPSLHFLEMPHEADITMNEFRKKGQFYDVILRVENREFYVHKVTLASQSGFFKSLFGAGMKEKNTEVIPLFDISPSIFSYFLESMYLKCPPKEELSIQSLFELSEFCHRTSTNDLFHWCGEKLSKKITSENFYEVAMHAYTVKDSHLLSYCKWFFNHNKEMLMNIEWDCGLNELIRYLSLATTFRISELQEELTTLIKKKMNHETFTSICIQAISLKNEGDRSLQSLCEEYVGKYRSDFEKQEMEEAKKYYQTLMTGLH